jgi:molybdopterin molybdotransferase
MIAGDEDAFAGQTLLKQGCHLRAQELGVLAACGQPRVIVYQRPRVGIISTGDEVVPIDTALGPGRVRDVNSYTLAGLVTQSGGRPVQFGIVGDRYDDLLATCKRAIHETDMVLVSGGSSVGTRDLTVDVLKALEQSTVLVHGVSVRPGKPTILAQCGAKAFWGLPGHVTSAMVVFMILVRPLLTYISGRTAAATLRIKARLTRNLASVQGRVDYVRVRLALKEDGYWAEPILGASGLIRTMVAAEGLVAVDLNSEGLDKGAWVDVLPI